jgi:hypothetical protein
MKTMLLEVDTTLGLAETTVGIARFDPVMPGKFSVGRPKPINDEARPGKTMFGSTFVINGVARCGESRAFRRVQEHTRDLAADVRSPGFNFEGLSVATQSTTDEFRVERSKIEEAGEYELERLFVRLCSNVAAIRVINNRGADQIAVRRLRVVRHRGSSHGTNEYSVLIEDDGFSVVPAISLRRDAGIFKRMTTTGISDLHAEVLQECALRRNRPATAHHGTPEADRGLAARFPSVGEASCPHVSRRRDILPGRGVRPLVCVSQCRSRDQIRPAAHGGRGGK